MERRTPLSGLALIRIHLPPAEAKRLETAFRSTDDRKLGDRLQIARMAPAAAGTAISQGRRRLEEPRSGTAANAARGRDDAIP